MLRIAPPNDADAQAVAGEQRGMRGDARRVGEQIGDRRRNVGQIGAHAQRQAEQEGPVVVRADFRLEVGKRDHLVDAGQRSCSSALPRPARQRHARHALRLEPGKVAANCSASPRPCSGTTRIVLRAAARRATARSANRRRARRGMNIKTPFVKRPAFGEALLHQQQQAEIHPRLLKIRVDRQRRAIAGPQLPAPWPRSASKAPRLQCAAA